MPQSLIHPIQLGKIQFASNLIQAPLAGVSCAPFRELIAQFGAVAYCATEMVSAKTLLGQSPKRYTYKSHSEAPLCFQLAGNHPDELSRAAEVAVLHGADLIDLNCGCPVDKLRKKGSGSRLLAESQHLYRIVVALRKITQVPLSIKIRVDGASADRFTPDVVKAIEDGGADFIVVHGRHWTEHYETPVHLDQIAAIVASVKIPVIGNGDVKDYASLQAMMRTGCRGVMIGRASVGKPWLFAELAAQDRGLAYSTPGAHEVGMLFLQHIQKLVEYGLESETVAVMQARKFSKYYARSACLAPQQYLQFNKISNLSELHYFIDHYFKGI